MVTAPNPFLDPADVGAGFDGEDDRIRPVSM
jgi:hypothetical protein